jgi:hypothetical protein
MRPTALAKKVALSLGVTRGNMPFAMPAKATKRSLLRTLPAKVTTSTRYKVTLASRCGIRHRAACRAVRKQKVHLLASAAIRIKVETSALVVAANAKERTLVGRLAGTSQKGNFHLMADAMGSEEVGAVVRLRKRKMMKL